MSQEHLDPDEEKRAVGLLQDLERLQGAPCSVCGRTICGHEGVLSVVLGFRDVPRCLGCLASGLGREREALRDHALEHILHRPCFAQGWRWSNAREGSASDRPSCLWGAAPGSPTPPETVRAPSGEGEPVARWDAGDMGCGDLVLELRRRLRELAPGAAISVRATDPGAPEDIPAWCRLTGNSLLLARHPEYRIARKRG